MDPKKIMAVTQQILANYLPFLRYKNVSTGAFAGGNSVTVADPSVAANSVISFHATSQPAGIWYVSSQTAGTGFVITSSDSETSTSFRYIIL